MNICVCGSGIMGIGIAQVTATAGYNTLVYDLDDGVLNKAGVKLETDLQNLLSKQKITAEKKKDILDKISYTTDIRNCLADLVIEAVVERMEIKHALFMKLSEQNPSTTLFASNTSSLSVSAIASEIPNPERFAGLHFFNPAPLMKLVEVVKGEKTSEKTMLKLVEFTRSIGKEPVICRDSPGFIVNRVARPYYIESLRIAEEGTADFQTIDLLLENAGFRMGPFRLMDLIGNDINYAVSCSVYEQLKKPERLKPSFIQEEKLKKGELGKKSGKGYYDYNTG